MEGGGDYRQIVGFLSEMRVVYFNILVGSKWFCHLMQSKSHLALMPQATLQKIIHRAVGTKTTRQEQIKLSVHKGLLELEIFILQL